MGKGPIWALKTPKQPELGFLQKYLFCKGWNFHEHLQFIKTPGFDRVPLMEPHGLRWDGGPAGTSLAPTSALAKGEVEGSEVGGWLG